MVPHHCSFISFSLINDSMAYIVDWLCILRTYPLLTDNFHGDNITFSTDVMQSHMLNMLKMSNLQYLTYSLARIWKLLLSY